MRSCPVCENEYIHPNAGRSEVFRMAYRIPDGWSLPSEIIWYTCDACGMIYGDGEFTQADLNEYYTKYYGYGVNNPSNIERLKMDAVQISGLVKYRRDAMIIDFGGAGDDGGSIIVNSLKDRGYVKAVCVGAGEPLPYSADVIYASHVIEHVYDLPETMERINGALAPDGLLIIDVPDAMGLLQYWQMPILDFNTKHLNHFTLRNLLDLGHHHGFELVHLNQYELENAPAFQAHFRRLDVAEASKQHIMNNMEERVGVLNAITGKVNVWGLGDISWHLLSKVKLDIVDYIDNDPAYRGQTYAGKPVQERPTNNYPILILAQGQRARLIENIRKAGIKNAIIEV